MTTTDAHRRRSADRDGPDRAGREGRGRSLPGGALRIAGALVGGALVVRGLRRRSLRGAATALAGGWLTYRALGGSKRIGDAVRTRAPRGRRPPSGGDETAETEEPTVTRSITVDRPADDLYEAWRDPERLSEILGHVGDVEPRGDGRLQWTVAGPSGREVSWETRVVEEIPGEYLHCESTADALVSNELWLRFEPASGDRGTVVTLALDVDPPGGPIGDLLLRGLDVVPGALAGTALDRFKALAESGEIPTLSGNPSARGRGDIA